MTALRFVRWTVVGRETDESGHVLRGEKGYKRTTAPQEEREEEFIRFSSRFRVMVSWGGVPIVATAEFSLTSGRCIGHPDWVLISELKPLRKLARLEFPKEKKPDDENEEAERETAAAPPATEREVMIAAPAGPDDGSEHPVPEPAAPDRQRSLFSE